MQNQLIREIKIHQQLQCVNIVNFYGFFDDEQFFYILIEYAVDGAIYSMLKNRNRLEESEIVGVIKGISEGVRYIHRMGYIHRDIKPENIVMHFVYNFNNIVECT